MSDRPTDDRLDRAIDEAIRDVMNVDADPAFRARVLARIEQSRPSSSWLRFAAAGALSAVLVAAIGIGLLMRPGAPEVPVFEPGAPVASITPAPPLPPVARTGTEPAPRPVRKPAPPDGRPVPQPAERGRLRAAVAPPAEAHDPTPADVEPVEPIGVVPVEIAPLADSPLRIAALAPLAEVQVAPIAQDGGGY